MQTARGCPHKCEFCASSILLTPKYKVKPPEKVIGEIRAIKRVWPRPFIEFADDNSFVHRPGGKDLLRLLAPEEVRWFTEADIAVGEDDELLSLMREAGCQQVLVGLESPSAESLRGLETASDWKARKTGRYLENIARIQSHGITVNGCFILGLDDHTPETFDQVFDFIRASGLYEAQVTLLTPFPGTPLYRRLKEEGRILQDGAWDRCTLFDINYQPRRMTPARLREGFHHLVRRLYSEEETAARRKGFRQRLRGKERLVEAVTA
ncbi:MAG: radical SAM protein [Kiritimatiellia bacterium]